MQPEPGGKTEVVVNLLSLVFWSLNPLFCCVRACVCVLYYIYLFRGVGGGSTIQMRPVVSVVKLGFTCPRNSYPCWCCVYRFKLGTGIH